MPERPRLGLRHLNTIGAVPGVPRLTGVGYERQNDAAYHRAIGERKGNCVTIQISIAGHGALWDRPGPWRGEPGWIDLPPGSALMYVVGEEQLSYGYPPVSGPPWEFVWATIEGEGALAMARGVIAHLGRVLRIAPTNPVVGELRRLACRNGHGMISAATSFRLATALLAALAISPVDEGDAIIRQAMVLLDGPSGRMRSISTVAHRLGVSREHLTRLFTKRIGRSPARWLADQRLAKAEVLLEDVSMPLAEVADQAGFTSATLLIRRFQALHGLTPGAYRRRLALARARS